MVSTYLTYHAEKADCVDLEGERERERERERKRERERERERRERGRVRGGMKEREMGERDA